MEPLSYYSIKEGFTDCKYTCHSHCRDLVHLDCQQNGKLMDCSSGCDNSIDDDPRTISFNKSKLRTFCNFIWPTYNLGPQSLPWPQEGSVNIEEIKALTDYLNAQGKLEEGLYASFFLNLALRQDILRQCPLEPASLLPSKVCPARKGVEEEKSVLEEILEDQTEEEFPPPYNPEINNPPVPAALFPVAPPLPPSFPQSKEEATDTNKKGGELLRPSHTTGGILYDGLDGSFTAPLMAPLRELPMGNHLVYVHIPFTTSDLFNWQRGMPPYREAPQSYVELVLRIVATHSPTVPDLHTLLAAFLGPEDKWQVLEAAEKHYKVKRAAINYPPLGQWPQVADLLSPTFEINANDSTGMEVLREAQEAIIQGLRKGVPKTVNFHRVHQIMQEPKESPTDFLIHLKDGFQHFTDLEPDAPQNEGHSENDLCGTKHL
ncbi:hypothetical protein E2320_003748 [Naja naja]|nr:hypothetical protein E2320_003748 [Naja naja]